MCTGCALPITRLVQGVVVARAPVARTTRCHRARQAEALVTADVAVICVGPPSGPVSTALADASVYAVAKGTPSTGRATVPAVKLAVHPVGAAGDGAGVGNPTMPCPVVASWRVGTVHTRSGARPAAAAAVLARCTVPGTLHLGAVVAQVTVARPVPVGGQARA